MLRPIIDPTPEELVRRLIAGDLREPRLYRPDDGPVLYLSWRDGAELRAASLGPFANTPAKAAMRLLTSVRGSG